MTRFDDQPMPSENILVVKRSLFDELGAFQGLIFDPQRYLGALLSRGNNFFLPRAAAENDPPTNKLFPMSSSPTAIVCCITCAEKRRASNDWSQRGQSESADT
jgi:hypothetical protein